MRALLDAWDCVVPPRELAEADEQSPPDGDESESDSDTSEGPNINQQALQARNEEQTEPAVEVAAQVTPSGEREWTEYLDDATQRHLESWTQCYVFNRRIIGLAMRFWWKQA